MESGGPIKARNNRDYIEGTKTQNASHGTSICISFQTKYVNGVISSQLSAYPLCTWPCHVNSSVAIAHPFIPPVLTEIILKNSR